MWVVVSLVVAENLGMFGFDTFETLKSKHETAREVGTFKNARVAAQDVVKATSSGCLCEKPDPPPLHLSFSLTYPQHPRMHARPLRVRRHDDASHRLGGAALDDVDLRRF